MSYLLKAGLITQPTGRLHALTCARFGADNRLQANGWVQSGPEQRSQRLSQPAVSKTPIFSLSLLPSLLHVELSLLRIYYNICSKSCLLEYLEQVLAHTFGGGFFM